MSSSRILFHYTSAEGLFGILQNRRLRATEFTFMNDPSEVVFAAEQVRKRLLEEIDSGVQEPELLGSIQAAVSFLERDYIDPYSPHQYQEDRSFLTSFSDRDDHLTLWRLYAGQAGYCIGFDQSLLLSWTGKRAVAKANAGDSGGEDESIPERERREGGLANFGLSFEFFDVLYGSEGSRSLIEDIVSIVRSTEFAAQDEWAKLRGALRKLVSVKHAGFADERESRLVVQAGSCHRAPSVRVSPAVGLVPYYDFVFPHSAIRSITAAPGQPPTRAVGAVKSMLMDGGRGAWSEVAVRASDIPFVW